MPADPQLPQEDGRRWLATAWSTDAAAVITDPDLARTYGREGTGWTVEEIAPASQVAALRDEVERLRANQYDCPDAEICKRCVSAADDDCCFPCDRLRTERDEARTEAERWERGAGKLAESNADFKAEVARLTARPSLSLSQIDLVFLLLSARPVELDVSVEQADELARTLRDLRAELNKEDDGAGA